MRLKKKTFCHVCTWQMCHWPHRSEEAVFFCSILGWDCGSQTFVRRLSFVIAFSRGLTQLYKALFTASAMWWNREPAASTRPMLGLAGTVVPSVWSTLLALVNSCWLTFRPALLPPPFFFCEIVNLYVHTQIKWPPFIFFSLKLLCLYPPTVESWVSLYG